MSWSPGSATDARARGASGDAFLVTGFQARIQRLRFRNHVLRRALSVYRDPLAAAQILKRLIKLRKQVRGNQNQPQWLFCAGRYFWDSSVPGWPSSAFDRFIDNEMNKLRPFREGPPGLQTAIVAITSRCPLHCDHCYEWDQLSSREKLGLDELKAIVDKLKSQGVSNLQFSGGEPLSRFEDLLDLVEYARQDTDLWILTSGFGLTAERAKLLKAAGLTGALVCLDHWDEAAHNRFRHHENAYREALAAIANLRQARLLPGLSLCATRDFVSRANLARYLELALSLGVKYLRILEPRRVGHFAGREVELDPARIALLRQFFLTATSGKARGAYAIIDYPGFYQRDYGCLGAGERYLYIDSRGDVHACPFCQNPVGNAVTDDFGDCVARLKRTGCHKYRAFAADREP